MANKEANLAECFSNLNLGSSGDDTERSKGFWNASTVVLKFGAERLWLDVVWKCERKPNLGMRNLDVILEERTGYKLELVGPVVDSYLGEINKGMTAKLGRSICTGLMAPLRLFMPYVLFRHIINIVVGYGGWLTSTPKDMKLEIKALECAEKVFPPARFQGVNFIKKRHFQKMRENGRTVFKYSGRAAVVIINRKRQQYYFMFKDTTRMIFHWMLHFRLF